MQSGTELLRGRPMTAAAAHVPAVRLPASDLDRQFIERGMTALWKQPDKHADMHLTVMTHACKTHLLQACQCSGRAICSCSELSEVYVGTAQQVGQLFPLLLQAGYALLSCLL